MCQAHPFSRALDRDDGVALLVLEDQLNEARRLNGVLLRQELQCQLPTAVAQNGSDQPLARVSGSFRRACIQPSKLKTPLSLLRLRCVQEHNRTGAPSNASSSDYRNKRVHSLMKHTQTRKPGYTSCGTAAHRWPKPPRRESAGKRQHYACPGHVSFDERS